MATYDANHWHRVDAADAFASTDRWHALAAQGLTLRLNTYTEALGLEADTPYRELRAEVTSENGFRGARLTREPAGHSGSTFGF
ncbi:hypothetical protein [Terrabacter sp. Root181]|uniref:hypothetical protein n=1 Tax=Terrabacter sp. Root181 TaxID=1736484 RepID=UPI0012FA4E31|nr:hypothetical protein [Terrabacter sp. Root181]